MKAAVRLFALCALSIATSPAFAAEPSQQFLGTATFTTDISTATIHAGIEALGPKGLTMSMNTKQGLTVSSGRTLDTEQFSGVLAIATGDSKRARTLLARADYASFNVQDGPDGTTIRLLISRPGNAGEADGMFHAVFGAPAPADLQIMQVGITSIGQHVFRLERNWETAVRDLTAHLKSSGHIVHEMPGPADMLVFARRADRTLVLFIQPDPSGEATRVVANLQE